MSCNKIQSRTHTLLQTHPKLRCKLGISIWNDTPVYPVQLTISLMYNLVSFARQKLVLTGMKCADLVKRSTMTQMALFLLNVVDNPVTKSMVILSHFHFGTSSGCIRPKGLWCSAFTCWQIMHLATKATTCSSCPSTSIVFSCLGTSLYFPSR